MADFIVNEKSRSSRCSSEDASKGNLPVSTPDEIITRDKRSPLYGCKELLTAGFILGCENRVITGCEGGVNSGGGIADGSGTCTNSMSGESCTFQTEVDGSDATFSDSVTCPTCSATTDSSAFTQCNPEGCMGGCPTPPPITTQTTTITPPFPSTPCDPEGKRNWTAIYYFDCRDAIQTSCSPTDVFGTCINPKSNEKCKFWIAMNIGPGIDITCPDGCEAVHFYSTLIGDEGWKESATPENCMVKHYDAPEKETIKISVGVSVGAISVFIITTVSITIMVVYYKYYKKHRGSYETVN